LKKPFHLIVLPCAIWQVLKLGDPRVEGGSALRCVAWGRDVEEAQVPDGVEGIGLAEAIAQLRDDLLEARASGAGSGIQLPIESLTVELKVVATTGVDGKAGFKVPIVNAELGGGGSWKDETIQTVTVQFGSPLDRDGNPVKVASTGEELKG
jgi:hypothetical protein